jgi:hypothetical protein
MTAASAAVIVSGVAWRRTPQGLASHLDFARCAGTVGGDDVEIRPARSRPVGREGAVIRASHGPNEAVEALVRDGRLDVPKILAQQRHCWPTHWWRSVRWRVRRLMSRSHGRHPKHTSVTSSADFNDARRGTLRSFFFSSGRKMFQSTCVSQSRHLRRKKTPPVLCSTSRVLVVGNLPLGRVVGTLGDKISNFSRSRRRTDLNFFSRVLFISKAPPGLVQTTSFAVLFRTMHFHFMMRQIS